MDYGFTAVSREHIDNKNGNCKEKQNRMHSITSGANRVAKLKPQQEGNWLGRKTTQRALN